MNKLPLRQLHLVNRKNISKKVCGFLLLVVFCISILPKAYFHEVLADHKDIPTCTLPHKSSAIHAKGFACHFDDLVVNAPFVDAVVAIEMPVTPCGRLQSFAGAFHLISESPSWKTNRGPPSF